MNPVDTMLTLVIYACIIGTVGSILTIAGTSVVAACLPRTSAARPGWWKAGSVAGYVGLAFFVLALIALAIRLLIAAGAA